ncbi:MAG: hypothetical protein LBN27_04270 [Prevotellaceae bacterium]|jgi:cell division protein FtsQ|nr:hypothetical protein [Prevotellaceae bacterium]
MKTWKIILITLGVAAVAVYLVFAFSAEKDNTVSNAPSINIKDADELQFVSEAKIKQILKKKGINPEKPVTEEKFAEVERIIEGNNAIKNCEVSKTVSGKVNIDIWQRKPVFRVMTADKSYFLDEEKVEIPCDFEYFVPIVTGTDNKDFIKGELFDFILFLQKDDFWQSQITQINVDKNKEITLVMRIGRHTVLLGTLDGYERKMNNLFTFYKKVLNEKGWNKYGKIDLQFDKQIVCTK